VQLADRGVFLLSQLGHHVADQLADELAPLGLHPAHFGILSHLRDADGLSQQQLSDLLGVHRNPMVSLIDELEAQGFVRRARHPVDRRAYAVQLTDRARQVLRDADTVADELEASVLAPLDEVERGQLIAMLHRVAAHADLPPGVHPGLYRRPPRRGAVTEKSGAAESL
jgi:DNA-binding MarR family transcriptional regulator